MAVADLARRAGWQISLNINHLNNVIIVIVIVIDVGVVAVADLARRAGWQNI